MWSEWPHKKAEVGICVFTTYINICLLERWMHDQMKPLLTYFLCISLLKLWRLLRETASKHKCSSGWAPSLCWLVRSLALTVSSALSFIPFIMLEGQEGLMNDLADWFPLLSSFTTEGLSLSEKGCDFPGLMWANGSQSTSGSGGLWSSTSHARLEGTLYNHLYASCRQSWGCIYPANSFRC